MTTDWNEPEEDRDDDPGLLGGGGVAETLGGDVEDELDTHGDNLSRVDEDEL